jgi:hypothetical protein
VQFTTLILRVSIIPHFIFRFTENWYVKTQILSPFQNSVVQVSMILSFLYVVIFCHPVDHNDTVIIGRR